jgi:preprotein translocase subunit SecA
MSTANPDPKMDASFWEKLGDGLSAFSEGIGKFLTRLLGSSNERYVRKLGYIRSPKAGSTHTVTPGSHLAQINELEPKMQALSDEELRQLTPKFKERLASGATLDDLLPEAFAACREAGWRTKKMRHFDTQMLGGIVLHRGNIAEMVTGEGKTLVATLPAYLNALEGKGVHVVTVNDYLARRDCEWMLPIYRALGITAGFIQSDMDPLLRRKAYDCDITYGTNSEFGFDYLRDNMKPCRRVERKEGEPASPDDQIYDPYYQQVQRLPLNFAIIDEVDNILIDEARTPLIISGQAFSDVRRYSKANDVAVQLTDLQKHAPGKYFEVKEKEHTCHLTDEGVRKAEELAGVESFYTAGNMEWPHLIDNALKAHHLYKKDKRYAVMRHPETNEMSIIIIDEFTGRLMIGRQWSDGLHQAVEAKHARDGVKIKEETQTLATVTLQNFFKMYKKLAGMTGTAMTEADEFWKIYHLEVIAIPTNRPLIRINSPDVIFRTEKEKWKAVVDELLEVNKGGRPVLVGTTTVDKSLKLSEMLKRRGIKHELLNALPEHAAREAEIVAQAGRVGAVTISTNMAGRGTDIILGGNPETLAWAQLKHKYASRLDVPEAEWKSIVDAIESREKMKDEGRKIAEMGGLHIVGTERHDSRRIDNQLRGRAGRQGDPGSSRFFLSLEDDLMRIFAGEWVKNLLGRLGMKDGEAIESGMVSRRISAAQKKVEERHFDSRKHLLEYDEVMDLQRKQVYGYRQKILEGANCKILILGMFERQIEEALDRFLDRDYGASAFAEFASNRMGVSFDASHFSKATFDDAVGTARRKASDAIPTQVQEALEENLGSEDPREWNWQAMSNTVNSRWGLKTTAQQLKTLGKDNIGDDIIREAERTIDGVDLSEGKPFLDADWGLRSLCDWARHQFLVKVAVEEVADKNKAALQKLLLEKVAALYHQKEVEFPVLAGVAEYMSDRGAQAPGGARYNREGLYHWAQGRFPTAAGRIKEEDFRTEPRSKLFEILLEISRAAYPASSQEKIDAKLDELFEGTTRPCDPEDAAELATWVASEMKLPVTAAELSGKKPEEVRDLLWTLFDRAYRPEMRQMERSLLLHQLDQSWKNHLYVMDHLRSGVGLVGYGQEDPKTVYKQEGMKEFQSMLEGVDGKVTESVFRMEESDAFRENLWVIGATVKETAQSLIASTPTNGQPQGEQGTTGTEKVTEPIRNRGAKVGRNDPCPCGSGKKYKNCHMRQTA